MSDLFQKFLERMNDKDFMAEQAAKIRQEYLIKEKQKKLVGSYFIPTSNRGFSKKLLDFLVWEKKHEELYYKKGILTNSNIFDHLMSIVQELGEDTYDQIPKDDRDFLSGCWDWKGYRFMIYCGQGCFWRIEKQGQYVFSTT